MWAGLAPISLEATLLPSSSAALSTQTLPTKVLRWAADTSSGAPYVCQDPTDPSKRVGFAGALIDALAAALGRTTPFVPNQWEGLIPGRHRGA